MRTRTPNNQTTTGYRISDDLWAVLQSLLPPHPNTPPFGGGRPHIPDRRCADAIFYVLRTGCQWQALDQTELCAHSVIWRNHFGTRHMSTPSRVRQ
jgi:transposase